MALAECPFCGKIPTLSHCEPECCGNVRSIDCECGVTIWGDWATDDLAIERWNKRQPVIFSSTVYPSVNDFSQLPLPDYGLWPPRDWTSSGCVGARYCPTCNVFVGGTCMCMAYTCVKCKNPYGNPPEKTDGIKWVTDYIWEKSDE